MKGFSYHKGIVLPFDKSNVDTDMILPKQFLQKINKVGFGAHLFHELRYIDDDGTIDNPDFILNHPIYQQSTVLLTRENFGCGSSREHALWALNDYGFKIIIAPSFGDIFYNNSFNNQILPIKLENKIIDELFDIVNPNVGINAAIDIQAQVLTINDKTFSFTLNPIEKQKIIQGMDDIGLTLLNEDAILAYEQKIPKFMF